jgi:hypothetical protein
VEFLFIKKNISDNLKKKYLAITKKCPDPECPPGTRLKPKLKRKSKMSSRFSPDENDYNEDNDKPQHQYYYIKAKYQASYEAILPISKTQDGEDINSEECFEFMCIPIVEETEGLPENAEEKPRIIKRCPEPKCPPGYTLNLIFVQTKDECAR